MPPKTSREALLEGVLRNLLHALKEGEFEDEVNHETCYLVTADAVALARARAVDAASHFVGAAEPVVVESKIDEDDLASIWEALS